MYQYCRERELTSLASPSIALCLGNSTLSAAPAEQVDERDSLRNVQVQVSASRLLPWPVSLTLLGKSVCILYIP